MSVCKSSGNIFFTLVLPHKNLAGFCGVTYISLQNAQHIAAALIEQGRQPEAPLAIIASATTAHEQVLTSMLQRVADETETITLQSPALLVVGEVSNSSTHRLHNFYNLVAASD